MNRIAFFFVIIIPFSLLGPPALAQQQKDCVPEIVFRTKVASYQRLKSVQEGQLIHSLYLVKSEDGGNFYLTTIQNSGSCEVVFHDQSGHNGEFSAAHPRNVSQAFALVTMNRAVELAGGKEAFRQRIEDALVGRTELNGTEISCIIQLA